MVIKEEASYSCHLCSGSGKDPDYRHRKCPLCKGSGKYIHLEEKPLPDLQELRSKIAVKIIKHRVYNEYTAGYHQCLIDLERDLFKQIYKPRK